MPIWLLCVSPFPSPAMISLSEMRIGCQGWRNPQFAPAREREMPSLRGRLVGEPADALERVAQMVEHRQTLCDTRPGGRREVQVRSLLRSMGLRQPSDRQLALGWVSPGRSSSRPSIHRRVAGGPSRGCEARHIALRELEKAKRPVMTAGQNNKTAPVAHGSTNEVAYTPPGAVFEMCGVKQHANHQGNAGSPSRMGRSE